MKKPVNLLLLFLGLTITVLVSYEVALWWVACSDSGKSFEEIKTSYMSHYPLKWRRPLLLTLSIIAGMIASACFLILMNKDLKGIKVVARLLAIFNLIFVSWHLFSLM